MTLPYFFRRETERLLANYDWRDVITGQGILSLYPTLYKDENLTFSFMSPTKSSPMTTTGLISSDEPYLFTTQTLKVPMILEGTVYISAYASGAISSLKTKIQIRNIGDSSIGSVIHSDTTERTTGSESFALITTYSNIDDYVNKINFEMKSSDGGTNALIYFKFFTEDDVTYNSATSSTFSTSYIAKEVENTYKDQYISKIEVWGRIDGAGETCYIDESNVTGQTQPITSISSEETSGAITNGAILLPVPLTKTPVKIGEKIIAKITKAGAGDIVVDPNNEIVTDESLKVNLPVKIDL